MAVSRDGCVVPTEPLSSLLQGFVGSWNRQRPAIGGQFRRPGARPKLSPVSAVDWLSQETRVPPGTIENIVSCSTRYRHTELRVADALLTAIGMPEALHDGTLPIEPNPSASAAAREACCVGSTPPPTFPEWSLAGA